VLGRKAEFFTLVALAHWMFGKTLKIGFGKALCCYIWREVGSVKDYGGVYGEGGW